MPTFNRLHGALATCVLVAAASSAYADDEDPTLTDSPQESAKCEQIPADCPSTTQTTTQTTPAPAPQATPPPPMAMEEPTYERPWYDHIGFGLTLGGGVDDFVGDALRSTTNIGGGWFVRFTAGTRTWLALEGSYIGSAQSINAIGLDNDAVLVGNGIQGALRLNVNVVPNRYVQPFVYSGVAWRHYDLSNVSINTSDVNDSDDVVEVPWGIGLAGYIGGFMADVRGEYRAAWGNDLIPVFRGDNDGALIGSLDRWAVQGSLGMEF